MDLLETDVAANSLAMGVKGDWSTRTTGYQSFGHYRMSTV